MPRPGPRPYECVRRAWHSDRHQPIRGSVIQEIFRVVNEVHCSATRKNREWQEKLPIVVLKAEEIMYSKANSEAEYSDLKTLWDRVNDAINTIIRRDESAETGELLQPCIEAALHLGCTPRRTSRSQRNESPRHYLRPETVENTSVSVPNDASNTKPHGTQKTISPPVIRYPQLPAVGTLNPLNLSSKGDNIHGFQNRTYNSIKKSPVNLASGGMQISASSATWSIYPLYYNNPVQPDESRLCSTKPLNSSSPPDASGFIFPSNHESSSSKVQGAECDLTLRLGSLVAPRGGIEKSCPLQVENALRFVPTNEQKSVPRSG